MQSVYVFVNGFIAIGVLAWSSRPVDAREPQSICVSIARAPTAYPLLFSPLAKTSSARNTIFGHPIGLIGGYAALVVTGAGPTRSGSRRYLLAKNPGGRSFAFSYGGRGEANSFDRVLDKEAVLNSRAQNARQHVLYFDSRFRC